MKFYLSIIKSRVRGILITPLSTWKRMKDESGYVPETILLLFVCCALTGLTSLIRRDNGWAAETFIPFFALMLSSVLIRFISPLMRRTNWEGSLNLITYAGLSTLLACILSYIFGQRHIILPAGLLYSFIQSVIALRLITGLGVHKCILLSLVSFLVVLASVYAGLVLLSR